MKLIFLVLPLVLLAACQQNEPDAALHETVDTYLRKNVGDPASYQSVRWGKPTPWLQKDADQMTAKVVAIKSTKAMEQLRTITDEKRFKELSAETKALLDKENSLRQSADTTRLGTAVMHTFRSKNDMGALVIDSARFIVLKTGEVKIEL